MAKYRVITNFKDLQDNGYYYKAGDAFPRSGKRTPSKKRLTELMTDENRRHMPMIEEVKAEEEDE